VNCKAEYFNRSKPKNCLMCGYEIGGSFEPAPKRLKISSSVQLTDDIFSVQTSNRNDRCFVSKKQNLWFCSSENCKISRSVSYNSLTLESFSCKHIEEAKNASTTPLEILVPQIDKFPCSEEIKRELQELIDYNSDIKPVTRVSEFSFVVLGNATAANPLGLCHVRKTEAGDFICSGKNCRSYSSKAKQAKTKSLCSHVLLLRSCFVDLTESTLNSTVPITSDETKATTSRHSTITLAIKTRRFPYHIPRKLIDEILTRDACTRIKQEGGWPNVFCPVLEKCLLCGGFLGKPVKHPGQHTTNSILITELNPFKKVTVLVKICNSRKCLAMHQAPVETLGK